MDSDVSISYNIYGAGEIITTYDNVLPRLTLEKSTVFYDSLTDSFTFQESFKANDTITISATPHAIENLFEVIVCSEANTALVYEKINLESHLGDLNKSFTVKSAIEKPLLQIRRKSTSSSFYKLNIKKASLEPLAISVEQKDPKSGKIKVDIVGGKVPYTIQFGNENMSLTTGDSGQNKASAYFDFINPGKYMVIVTDSNKNTASAQVLVETECKDNICPVPKTTTAKPTGSKKRPPAPKPETAEES